MKLLTGLKIEYWPVSEWPDGSKILVAEIKVGEGLPSKSFITTPIIRELISKANYAKGREFGEITLNYSLMSKTLKFIKYYPIPNIRGSPKQDFLGKGIAAMIEAKVEQKARSVFPQIDKVVFLNPTKFRIEQLKNRGFSFWEIKQGVSGKDFTKSLREKLAKDLRVKRKLK